jgi:hypothetical protein
VQLVIRVSFRFANFLWLCDFSFHNVQDKFRTQQTMHVWVLTLNIIACSLQPCGGTHSETLRFHSHITSSISMRKRIQPTDKKKEDRNLKGTYAFIYWRFHNLYCFATIALSHREHRLYKRSFSRNSATRELLNIGGMIGKCLTLTYIKTETVMRRYLWHTSRSNYGIRLIFSTVSLKFITA